MRTNERVVTNAHQDLDNCLASVDNLNLDYFVDQHNHGHFEKSQLAKLKIMRIPVIISCNILVASF